jgi:hypothetical protein
MTDTTLLLVVGPGRSGTSTMAGALSMLGAHVPGPYLDANKSNPKGFFESSWSVSFHNAILRRAFVGVVDARPEATQLFHQAVTPKDRDRLSRWLTEQRADHDLMVLKDPRVVWSFRTFTSVADQLGLRLAVAVMLRHPAEVVASRLDYYRRPDAALDVPGYQTRDLAGWLNMLTICEKETRGLARAFVSYQGLLTDWRATMRPALDELGVSLPVPDAAEHHQVDEFIDPGLNRHQASWDETSAPAELEELSQRAWDECAVLAEHSGDEAAALAGLDEVRAGYARMYGTARALVHDEFVAANGKVRQARAEAKEAKEANRAKEAKDAKDAKEVGKTAMAARQDKDSGAAQGALSPLPRVLRSLRSRRWPGWVRKVAAKVRSLR